MTIFELLNYTIKVHNALDFKIVFESTKKNN